MEYVSTKSGLIFAEAAYSPATALPRQKDSRHVGSWIREYTRFPFSENLLHARQMAWQESLHALSARLPPILCETARTYTNDWLQLEFVFSFFFPVSV